MKSGSLATMLSSLAQSQSSNREQRDADPGHITIEIPSYAQEQTQQQQGFDLDSLIQMANQWFGSLPPSVNAYASGWAPAVHGFVPSEIGFGKPLLPGTGDALAGGGGYQPQADVPQLIPGLTGGVTGLSNASLYNGGNYSPVQQSGMLGPYAGMDAHSAIATGIGPNHEMSGYIPSNGFIPPLGWSLPAYGSYDYSPVTNGNDPSVYGGSPFGMQNGGGF